MSDVEGWIDGLDPFDPAVAAAVEEHESKAIVLKDEQYEAYIRMRGMYYKEVFSPGPTSQDAIDFVMFDLAVFARAYGTTYTRGETERDQQQREGRKELFFRIMGNAKLPHEALFTQYMNAVIEKDRAQNG